MHSSVPFRLRCEKRPCRWDSSSRAMTSRCPSVRTEDRGTNRIIEVDAKNLTDEVVLEGQGRFFTTIMGVHQRLANGNILVNSSGEGNVIEFAPDGTIVWSYRNMVSDTKIGRVYNAMLLPEHMGEAFFRQALNSCAP